jgi:hypothetical protein
MSESSDKNNDDINFYPDDDASNIEKVWVIDWNNKFQRTSSEERTNYQDALKIFNEKAKEGKNAILYEVQKSVSNGKILKRIPILNSSKYAERKKDLNHDKKEPAIKKAGGGVFSSRKSRFIILFAILVSFIITLYILNIMASGGGGGTMSSHHVILEKMGGSLGDATPLMPYSYNS